MLPCDLPDHVELHCVGKQAGHHPVPQDEINALLGEMLSVANSIDGQGNYVFSGHRAKTQPFRVHSGRVEGSLRPEVITGLIKVDQEGGASKTICVPASCRLRMNRSRNRVRNSLFFWASTMRQRSKAPVR